MEFIDKEGHVFSCGTSGTSIGWREEQPEYVFWTDSPVTGPDLSVSEYYVTQIIPYIGKTNTLATDRSAVALSDIISVTVTCESSIFKLKACDIAAPGDITFDMGSDELSSYITNVSYNRESLIISNDDIICPFFVVCMSDEPGELLANALIDVKYNNNGNTASAYTVIRLGGVFRETSEKLIVNAGNNGVDIPAPVMGAVYSAPADFDASVYNAKLREYMMNKPELTAGGYAAMLKAVKWFGWGDKLTARRLRATDNKRIEQYARDDFGKTARQAGELYFKESGNVSLLAKENSALFKQVNSAGDEAVVAAPSDWAADFSGELLPETEDLFGKYVRKDGAPIERYEPYYMWDSAVIMAKLSLLKYYYRKYFCPAATSVRTVSLERAVTMQDIKSLHYSVPSVCEAPVLCAGGCVVDIFGESCYDIYNAYSIIKTVRFESAMHYMDRALCEFSNYADESLYDAIGDYDENAPHKIYESHEMCAAVPLRFWSSMEEKLNHDENSIDTSYIYDAQIILSRGGEEVWSCAKRFCQSENSVFSNIIIIPKLMTGVKDMGWEGEWRIDVRCNGRWFSARFNIISPEPEVEIGYIEYKYDSAFAEKPVMWEPALVSVTNSDYISDIMTFKRAGGDMRIIDTLSKKYTDTFNLPSPDTAPHYYNILLYIDLNDATGAPLDEKTAGEALSAVKNVCGDISGHAYDAYLMRDDAYAVAHGANRYYIVLISKCTIKEISEQTSEPTMQIKSNVMSFVSEPGNALETAISQFAAYDNIAVSKSVTRRFLINRMHFVACDNGAVPNDKIICCSIYKNNTFSESPAGLEDSFYANSGNLPFRMDVTSAKWRFIPYSVAISSIKTCSSKANMALMSLPESSADYMRGYYNVEIDYSIDGAATKTYRLPNKIRVR